jgi:L-fucose isomerase-like protein
VPTLTGEGPYTDVYSVMNNWGANHGAISYGHIGGDLISLASLLRIPGRYAQRAAGTRFPSQQLEPLRRDGLASRRLPRLPDLRAAV